MKQTVCPDCGKRVHFLPLENNPKSLTGDACVNTETELHFGGTTTAEKF